MFVPHIAIALCLIIFLDIKNVKKEMKIIATYSQWKGPIFEENFQTKIKFVKVLVNHIHRAVLSIDKRISIRINNERTKKVVNPQNDPLPVGKENRIKKAIRFKIIWIKSLFLIIGILKKIIK